MNICLFCASSNTLDSAYYNDAYELGKLIGKNGCGLVYGGSERGIMKSCADGVLSTGGSVIGVAPQFFTEAGVLSTNCTQMIYTTSMSERKQKMEELADAFAVLPGGIGTFDEFFETLTLRQLNVHCKPLALLNTLGYFDDLVVMLQNASKKGFLSEDCLHLFKLCSTPAELLSFLCSGEDRFRKGRGLSYGK